MVYQKLALLAQNKFGQAQKRPSTLGDDARGERPRADARGTQPTAADEREIAEWLGNKDNGGRRPPRPREGRIDLNANDKVPAIEASLDRNAPAKVGQG